VTTTAGLPPAALPDDEQQPVVLEAVDLKRYFRLRRRRIDTGPRRVVHAVDGVSVQLRAGAVVALVGESGSGKSTLARVLAQLQRSTGGEVRLQGRVVRAWRGRALRRYAGSVQYIFQDPFSSLNPVHTIRHHLVRPLRVRGVRPREMDQRLAELLDLVHLTPAEWFLPKFPHELSGGQLQRIVIARALAADPIVLLADEPVSMLDVSIRLGVLNLLQELQDLRKLAILYVTHDMASARYFAQTILVMYGGQLVEGGPSEAIVQAPAHPYTQLLLDSAPDPERTATTTRSPVKGEPTSIVNPAANMCRFAPRCPHAMDICRSQAPPAFDVGPGQWALCWLHSPKVPRPG
jgi:peptide/nickel transport system ATP-binding protein